MSYSAVPVLLSKHFWQIKLNIYNGITPLTIQLSKWMGIGCEMGINMNYKLNAWTIMKSMRCQLSLITTYGPSTVCGGWYTCFLLLLLLLTIFVCTWCIAMTLHKKFNAKHSHIRFVNHINLLSNSLGIQLWKWWLHIHKYTHNLLKWHIHEYVSR